MISFRKLLILAVATAQLVTSQSQAYVNVKNGNYSISYTDLISPDPGPDQVAGRIEITRTYNSKATSASEFGYGWGWNLATSLRTDNEGGIAISEHGSGALILSPDQSGAASRERAAELVRNSHLAELFPRRSDYLPPFQKAARNLEFRHAWTTRNIRAGLEAPTHPGAGWRQSLPDYGYTVFRTPDGYERKHSNGRREIFNFKGRLVMIREPNGYFYRIRHNQKGQIETISDINGYEIRFVYDSAGVLRGMSDSAGQKTEYKLEDERLVWSSDPNGNSYSYEYDAKINLTGIQYADGSRMSIEYGAQTSFAEKVIARDGTVSTYGYEEDPNDKENHYWTNVRRYDRSETLLSSERFEYKIAALPNGQRNAQMTHFTFQPKSERQLVTEMRETVPNADTRTVSFRYSEDLAQLLEINDSLGAPIAFTYGASGQVKSFTHGQSQVALEHNGSGALIKVQIDSEPFLEFVAVPADEHGFRLEGAGTAARQAELRAIIIRVRQLTHISNFPRIFP